MVKLSAAMVVALAAAGIASAKEIGPGELMICGATQCRTVNEAGALSRLLWGSSRVVRARTPRVGSPIFQLRFEERPAGAVITATAIRVHGLNCGRFRRGRWYLLPAALRGLTAGMQPKRLRAAVPRSC